MMKLKTQLWTNPMGKRFVMLPEDDFTRTSELIEDRGLSRILKEAVKSDTHQRSIPFAEVKRQLAAQRKAGKRKGKR